MTKPAYPRCVASSLRLSLLAAAVSTPSLGCDDTPADDVADRVVQPDELDLDAIAALPSIERAGAVRSQPMSDAPRADVELRAPSAPMAQWWTNWVSNEDPPTSCGNDEIAVGYGCGDTNCDDVSLSCESVGGLFGRTYWSGWISEEGPNNVHICPFDHYVTDIVCTGKNCDSVAVGCTETGLPKSTCYWTGYLDPATNVALQYSPNAGEAISGIQCAGPYCDRIRAWVCSYD